MKKSLIIAEKPSVGKDIGRVLNCNKKTRGYLEGDRYIVTWAMGHLLTLKNPEEYDKSYQRWDLDVLPIIPKKLETKLIPSGKGQFFTIKKLADRKDVDEIIIATDAGREGELVARWILDGVKKKSKMKRLWISSVTDKAIRDGFKNLKDLSKYDNLYKSALARSEADWIVGINGTRALTTKYNANLSCGRVQTPTLNMVYKREEEIRNFISKDFYRLEAKIDGIDFRYDGEDGDRIYDEKEAASIKKDILNGKVKLVDEKLLRKKQKPSKLYDLTELQKDAYKIYGYSAKETLRYMQNLYERHKALTYPRTDSRYLTEDIMPTLKDRLKSIDGIYKKHARKIFIKNIKKNNNFINDKKVSDHHAIIPTEEFIDIIEFSNGEKNIYNLVVRRFLEVLSDDYIYDEKRIELDINGYKFKKSFKESVSLGFKEIGNVEKEVNKCGLKDLKLEKVNLIVDKTKAKPYLNEGSLIGYMENPVSFLDKEDIDKAKTLGEIGGIGTVATRAEIIDKLFNSGFVEKRSNNIITTSKGRQLLELVPEELKSPAMTASWEWKLEKIEKGNLKKQDFINEAENYTRKIIDDIKKSNLSYRHDNLTSTKCPICGEFMLEVKTKTGKRYVCKDINCKGKKNIYKITNRRCPDCKKKLKLRGEKELEEFFCQCGFKESMQTYNRKKKDRKKIPNKREVNKFLKNQDTEFANNPFEALKGIKFD